MTLQDVKRRLKVMKVRGYNANTVRDMEWLVAEVRALEIQIEGARRERDIAVRTIERIRGHINEYLDAKWVQP
jgi:hypothetical protein